MIIDFTVPRKLVLNSNQRLHYRQHAARAALLRKMGEDAGNRIPDRFTRFKVTAIVYPPTRRRIDPANLWPTVKPLVDGLTDAALWPDDDFEHLIELSFRYGGLSEIKDAFRVELAVLELGDS